MALLPGDLEHVFFSDSGSVSVEVAMKMAIQAALNRGERRRTKILAFRGGYHGDTLATMAVCDPDEGMHALFKGVLPEQIIADLPRDAATRAALDVLLTREGEHIAAILVEPIVQGAGGMLFHEPAVLADLREAATRHGCLLIFDEIFTGFGRTGSLFACERAGVVPDILTLSKALTGGTMGLAATIASRRVFEAFLSDDPRPRADAWADLHGQPARLRRGQRLARPVRARAAPSAGSGNRGGAARGAGVAHRAPRNPRCAHHGRHRRRRAGGDPRHGRAQGALRSPPAYGCARSAPLPI